ncbi:hypothetical protein DFH07DRAFT_1009707 [Mycena maculata]|uniref:Uncharacterized protein n=1 Tax=Mycena maculata TaxID=230809 RepID=A0AAD7HEZ4_9AGAR|nr:hypothetical protein DFH07DRAFT_1009707 [Mycena maculata]
MAVLAPLDWQYREDKMASSPSQSTSTTSNNQSNPSTNTPSPTAAQGGRERLGPQHLPPPMAHQTPTQQQQYPFTQQPQGTWTPSLTAQPFYPGAFYAQNTPNLSPGMGGPPTQPPYPGSVNPYFDPANAQLAQWAYQQMMFNAQMQQQQHAHHQQGDFFAPPQGMHGTFNPFPSGTPPPRQEGSSGNAGFHPYRRPQRQQSSNSQSASHPEPPPPQQQEWRPQPPYGRPDASGSSSSVDSQGRTRTSSNNSQHGRPHANSSASARGSPSPVGSAKGSSSGGGSGSGHGAQGSANAPSANANAPGGPPRIPHHRNSSSGSSHSAHSTHHAPSPHHSPSSPGPASPASSNSASSSTSKLARPSPLSQGVVASSMTPSSSTSSTSSNPRPSLNLGGSTTSRAERRISRDDSSLALSSLSLLATRASDSASATPAVPAAGPGGHISKSGASGGGLKGRLRRALSFNSSVALREEVGAFDEEEGEDDPAPMAYREPAVEDSDSDESIKASVVNPARAGAGAAPKMGERKTPTLIKSAVQRVGAAAPFPPPPASASSSSASAPSPLPSASSGPASGTSMPLPKKKSRAASLFNARLNASTDNISLSSTVSSASVMIRKLGSMGRLARRNSLAGITGLFKDRGKKKEGEAADDDTEADADAPTDAKGKGKDKKDKKKDKEDKKKAKSSKGQASEASVSHATAELEAGDWSVPENASAGGIAGLSPAAKLARQHTLKSNAEAAAKAREAAARNAASTAANGGGGSAGSAGGVNGGGVAAWDRNTATRRGAGGGAVGEDGVLVESDDDDEPEYAGPQQQAQRRWEEDEDEDEEWGLLGGEEDDTIRVENPAAAGGYQGQQQYEEGYDEGYGYGEQDGGYGEGEEDERWAVDVRRSVERTRVPARGILKGAGTYSQSLYLPSSSPFAPSASASASHPHTLRARSNSYNSPPERTEPGPLARMPSPDPDHIDGLHRHGSHSSQHGASSSPQNTTPTDKRSSIPSLPPLAFELGSSTFDSPQDSPQATPTASTYAQAGVQFASPAPAPLFTHPNSSAPALTTLGLGHPSSSSIPPHRAATTPAKKLAFASNLSVYDTFSASMYDRRSEPATWSRLTPALAQRIKEELNSYKMEEMEVHAASRIHTQFFV